MPNLYDLTVPAFIKTLEMLSVQLEKTKAHAESLKARDVNSILQDRLVFDQFPLIRQIQITCDTAKIQSAAFAGVTAPAYEDTETTFEQAHERIANTVAFLKTLTTEQFAGREDVVLPFKYAPGMGMKASEQVVAHTLPNFYFHAATAYAIMRKNGVQIGKMDFLGALPLVAIAE
jgi:uncharacterized protein